jgi:hypothetical protein
MKRAIFCFVALLTGVLFTAHVSAQSASGKVIDQMKSFSWMVGDWSGDAWYLGREQKKVAIVQKEHIINRLDGAIITMEGSGYDKSPVLSDAKLVFQAFGILTYDNTNSKYVLRAYRGENFIDSDFVTNPDGTFTWSFNAQYGKTKYIITHTPEGKWNERGFLSQDGTNWNQFFEMTLSKL